MSFESPIDHPRLFLAVVSAIPLVSTYLTTRLVRWSVRRRGATVTASRYSVFAVVLGLHLVMAVSGGLLLEVINGIPAGIGLGWTVVVLFSIYVGPAILGLVLFDGYLLTNLVTGGERNSRSSVLSLLGQNGVLGLLAETNLLLLGFHVISLPSFFVFAIIVAN